MYHPQFFKFFNFNGDEKRLVGQRRAPPLAKIQSTSVDVLVRPRMTYSGVHQLYRTASWPRERGSRSRAQLFHLLRKATSVVHWAQKTFRTKLIANKIVKILTHTRNSWDLGRNENEMTMVTAVLIIFICFVFQIVIH